MAKKLSQIVDLSKVTDLKGTRGSKHKKLSLGKNPGVDYAPKMKDERDFVAMHDVEEIDDYEDNPHSSSQYAKSVKPYKYPKHSTKVNEEEIDEGILGGIGRAVGEFTGVYDPHHTKHDDIDKEIDKHNELKSQHQKAYTKLDRGGKMFSGDARYHYGLASAHDKHINHYENLKKEFAGGKVPSPKFNTIRDFASVDINKSNNFLKEQVDKYGI